MTRFRTPIAPGPDPARRRLTSHRPTLFGSALLCSALLAGSALTGPATAAAAPAATTAPAAARIAACATAWGSTPESAAAMNPSPLYSVRTGRHTCFDRVVFQIAGSTGAGWDVSYVDAVRADGSGEVVGVPGGARLQVVLHHPSYDEEGVPTFGFWVGRRVADVAGYRTLRSVVAAGSFEGYTTLGVGTRARLPFRVFALADPGGDTRIVLDVAHRW